jgi:formamidopyrimidine-DNA glycosylase
MPELPEVETVVRDLRPLVCGHRITDVVTGPHRLRRPWRDEWNERVVGRTVQALDRRGKWIIAELDSPARLLVHLGMTGQFTVAPLTDPLPTHTHWYLVLDGRWRWQFRDIRRFGSVELLADAPTLEAFLAKRLGPEPFALQAQPWLVTLNKSQRPLKALLLDQAVVAGVGNIYADEALFAAGLHPLHPGAATTPAQAERLRVALAAVLTRAIDERGSTIRNYVGGSGLAGRYQTAFAVYGRAGQACRQCGTEIGCIRVAGRSTHYCPTCQPQASA